MYKPLFANVSISLIVSGVQPHMTISHDESITNSNRRFIQNSILNIESFGTHVNVKKSSIIFQLILTFGPEGI